MSSILVVTVGGKPQPIQRAILDYRPDYVYFVASGPDGSISQIPGVVQATGLKESQYSECVVIADDLNDCFSKIYAVLKEIRATQGMCRVIADYTGGTKTMSGALILAALEDGQSELSLVTGDRPNLVRVDDGTEMAMQVGTSMVQLHRRLTLVETLFDRYDYSAAQTVLGDLARKVSLPPDAQSIVQQHMQLARGFDAWDTFHHARAYTLLKAFAGQLGGCWSTLLKLTEKIGNTGYEPVFDLVLNAERCAVRQRYDDAVARLYRAVELLAQRRLHDKHKIDTGNVDLTQVPLTLQDHYGALPRTRDRVAIGQQEAYRLLQALGDPLGEAYRSIQGPLETALSSRNHSILAHGSQPIGEDAYRTLHGLIRSLLEEVAKPLRTGRMPTQFPALGEILIPGA